MRGSYLHIQYRSRCDCIYTNNYINQRKYASSASIITLSHNFTGVVVDYRITFNADTNGDALKKEWISSKFHTLGDYISSIANARVIESADNSDGYWIISCYFKNKADATAFALLIH